MAEEVLRRTLSAADNDRRARFGQPACRNAVAIIALTKGLTAASCAAG
jgi:hypothetical protein